MLILLTIITPFALVPVIALPKPADLNWRSFSLNANFRTAAPDDSSESRVHPTEGLFLENSATGEILSQGSLQSSHYHDTVENTDPALPNTFHEASSGGNHASHVPNRGLGNYHFDSYPQLAPQTGNHLLKSHQMYQELPHMIATSQQSSAHLSNPNMGSVGYQYTSQMGGSSQPTGRWGVEHLQHQIQSHMQEGLNRGVSRVRHNLNFHPYQQQAQSGASSIEEQRRATSRKAPGSSETHQGSQVIDSRDRYWPSPLTYSTKPISPEQRELNEQKITDALKDPHLAKALNDAADNMF